MRRIEVLAVEDASSDLFHLTNVLDDMGVEHSLSVADDGERAVDFLLKRGTYAEAPTPDLVLLDVHLPLLNGLEVLCACPLE
jgi:CheY-like chemotaxis protein